MRRFRRQELRVERFELVEVGPGLSLVRIAGEWRSGTPSGVTLVARHGGEREELTALPEPPGSDSAGEWRAAFSARGEAPGASYELRTSDGRRVALPAPVPRGAPVATAASRPKPTRPPPVAADPDSDAFRAVRDALRTERARAERTEASLREQLRIMVGETAEFLSRLEGYELRRAELEKELSWERLLHKETRRMLVDAETERDSFESRVDETASARRQLAEARERVGELERALEERELLLGSVRASVERGVERLAAVEARLLTLRDRAARAPAPAVDASRDVLSRAWEQADRGTERLAALERRLVELRERVA